MPEYAHIADAVDRLTGPVGAYVNVTLVHADEVYSGTLVDRVVWEDRLDSIVVKLNTYGTGRAVPSLQTIRWDAVESLTRSEPTS